MLIVAHGTDLNENSAVAAKREAEKIRALGKYAAVLNVYMEEPPLVSDWRKLTKTHNVVVVPFFISDGLHSYEDIPVLLGIVDAAALTAATGFKCRLTMARFSGTILTRSMVARCSMLHPSVPTPVLQTSSSSRRRLQKVEFVLALGLICARLLSRE